MSKTPRPRSISVRITARDYHRVRIIARRENRTIAAVIGRAVQAYDQEARKAQAALRNRPVGGADPKGDES